MNKVDGFVQPFNYFTIGLVLSEVLACPEWSRRVSISVAGVSPAITSVYFGW